MFTIEPAQSPPAAEDPPRRLGGVWPTTCLRPGAAPDPTPGVYFFYECPLEMPRYVGRSDTDVLRRMYGRGYRYFQYMPCATAEEAYRWECIFYHRYFPSGNRVHPARPDSPNARCPEPRCAYGEADR